VFWGTLLLPHHYTEDLNLNLHCCGNLKSCSKNQTSFAVLKNEKLALEDNVSSELCGQSLPRAVEICSTGEEIFCYVHHHIHSHFSITLSTISASLHLTSFLFPSGFQTKIFLILLHVVNSITVSSTTSL
jgi:hypothetical protein